jgi:hypothetical protein
MSTGNICVNIFIARLKETAVLFTAAKTMKSSEQNADFTTTDKIKVVQLPTADCRLSSSRVTRHSTARPYRK